MVDRIDTLEATVRRLARGSKPGARRAELDGPEADDGTPVDEPTSLPIAQPDPAWVRTGAAAFHRAAQRGATHPLERSNPR
jgi:hypothetical protein